MEKLMTRAEAIKMSLVEVTASCRPEELVDTTAGKLRFDEWCNKEADRFHASGRPAVLVSNGKGKVSLWAEPLPPRIVPPAMTVD